MRLSKPFIRLPFNFDAERLAVEVSQYASNQWMPHPNGLRGNSAIALVSSGGGDNNSFEGEKKATPHLASSPYTRQVMASFGELLSRSRFMKLDAGSEVSFHVDFNYHWYSRVRIHIPIITNPKVMFHCGREQLHMAAGECWIFDSWRRHNVINNSAEDRVHLVIDTAGSSRFWDRVRAVENLSVDDVKSQAQYVGYREGVLPTLRVERYSGLPVMAPGECSALVDDLIADFSANPENPPEQVQRHRILMTNFSSDWRELWLEYGHGRDGFPHYQALIDRTRAQLDPNPRVLVTYSNGLGVTPIFVQRVLNAALVPEAQI